jgi:hypothetical protein
MKKIILLGLLAMFSITSSFAYVAAVSTSSYTGGGFKSKQFYIYKSAVGYYFEAEGNSWSTVQARYSDGTCFAKSISALPGGGNNTASGVVSKSGRKVTYLFIEATTPNTYGSGAAMCMWTW